MTALDRIAKVLYIGITIIVGQLQALASSQISGLKKNNARVCERCFICAIIRCSD